jgi:hypothetical protein
MFGTLLLLVAGLAPDTDPAILVKRLGDTSFAVRQEAEAHLSALGLSALAALEAGARDADPEVRVRSSRLLVQVRAADRKARIEAFLAATDDQPATTLPGWARYRALVPSPTRKGFVAVFEGDSELVTLASKDARKAAAELATRANKLATLLLLPGQDEETLASLPAWLLVAADPDVPVEPATLTALYAGLAILVEREAPRKELLTHPDGPALLLAVLQRGGDAAAATTLPLAADLGLKPSRAWATKLATTPTTPVATRAHAVRLLGLVGERSDVAILTPLLTDKTAVGTVTFGTTRLSTELGDVALAAILHLRGEKLADYGFTYTRIVPGQKTLPSPERLGFADAATRTAAFAKWREKMK